MPSEKTRPTALDRRRERMADANAVIAAIAANGRRFFHYARQDRTARFEIGSRGVLEYRDDQTNVAFAVTNTRQWPNFSQGGTMKSLVLELARYVREGIPIRRGHFGPWPEWVAGGDLWAYGPEAMALVRAAVAGNPAVATQGAPQPDPDAHSAAETDDAGG